MLLAVEKVLSPARRRPHWGEAIDLEPHLNIAVIFTSVDATLAALRVAGALASKLSARIKLLVPQIVPYPLPLGNPPVLREFSERRFRVIAEQSQVETNVRLYLCRDRWQAVAAALEAHSLVVIGGRKRWWPNFERALARKLRRAGHEVIFARKE